MLVFVLLETWRAIICLLWIIVNIVNYKMHDMLAKSKIKYK